VDAEKRCFMRPEVGYGETDIQSGVQGRGGITYGPVCLGQTVTYAVKDHFWVYFVDPRYDPSVQDPKLGLET
jgi:hypothetical protein